MSTIKINRAKALVAHTPVVEAAVWDSISETLRSRLTAAELAEVARSLDTHWHKAISRTEASVCAEGAVYDARRSILREIT